MKLEDFVSRAQAAQAAINDLGAGKPIADVRPHTQAHRECPGCGQDCTRVGLPDLVYGWVPCECDRESYAHLVEQIWHLACIRGSS